MKCPVCGKAFEPYRPQHKYCSKTCNQKAYRIRRELTKTPEQKEADKAARKARWRRRYAEHREEILLRNKRYKWEHYEKWLEWQRRYYAEHREEILLKQKLRAQRRKSQQG